MKNWNNKKTEDLFKVILKLKNVGEAKKFFRDLLTEEEYNNLTAKYSGARGSSGTSGTYGMSGISGT